MFSIKESKSPLGLYLENKEYKSEASILRFSYELP